MDSIPKRDIYHIYELEAHDFKTSVKDPFWKNLFQTGGVFIFLTFVVFFMINFRFISSQLVDWYEVREYRIATDFSAEKGVSLDARKFFISENDSDQDGLSDKLEVVLGTNINKSDSDDDGFGDFQELSRGHNPSGEGKIKAEMEIVDAGTFPVDWQENNSASSSRVILVKDETKSIFNKSFLIPPGIIKNQDEKLKMNLFVYLNDGKVLKAVYEEKTREISSENFGNKKNPSYGVQVVSGWPKGTDWQRLIIETELVSLNVK